MQELIVRALKQAGVPVAGADRLALRDHIAVQDLIALGRATLLPEDDLNLACLLKSPLLGLGEDELFELAWDRGEASLLERLRARPRRGPRGSPWPMRGSRLAATRRLHAAVRVLCLGAGRRWRAPTPAGPARPRRGRADRGLSRPALAYEQGHPATMESFLHWLCLGTDELKRDPEKARDVVRVTTVHGAKGLEAPIVFLADAGPRGRSRRGRLLWSDPRSTDRRRAAAVARGAGRARRLDRGHRRARGRGASRRNAAACSTWR